MTLEISPDAKFAQFFLNNFHKLTNVVTLWTGDRHLAEDIAQEVMATLVNYSHYEKPEILMFRMARQRLMRSTSIPIQAESIDRESRDVDKAVSLPSVDEVLSSDVTLDVQLMAALKNLPTRQKEVIVLEVLCDMSQDQVAEIVGISVSAVKTHKARGLKKLEALMASRLNATGPGAEQPVGGV